MATPIWNDKEKRWIIDTTVNAKRRKFTSSIPGRPGRMAVVRKHQAALDGESDKFDWRLEKCWQMYLSEVKRTTSYDNWNQREKYGRLYILPRLGHRKTGTIRIGDWQDCITYVDPVNGKPLAKKSLMNLKATIVNFCRFAKEQGMLDIVPDALRLPRNARTVGKVILQPDQLRLLFQPSSEWYINAWRLMATTGMRPGEVYGLKTEDIRDGLLTVRRSINWHGETTEGKNKNARREFLLHKQAADILEEQWMMTAKASIASPWIFPEPDGSPPSQRNAYTAWRRYSKATGLKVSPYCLRHTWVSLTKSMVPKELQQDIVGHAESMDTHGVYGHQVDGDMKRAARLTGRALAKHGVVGLNGGVKSIKGDGTKIKKARNA